jgi:hypothetical protein
MSTKFIVKAFPPVPNVSMLSEADAVVTSEALTRTDSPSDLMMGCFIVICI